MTDLSKLKGHTLGPWRAGRDTIEMDGYIYAGAGASKIIGQVRGWGWLHVGKGEKAATIEQDANGRLLAAAPDLLAEVTRLRGLLVDIGESTIMQTPELQVRLNAELEGK